MQRTKRTLIGLGLLGLLALTAVGCAGGPPGQGRVDLTTETATAFIGDLSASATASGKVQPRRQASLSVSGSGVVEAINVRPGDNVAAGDVLLTLDTELLELDIIEAEQTVAMQQAALADLLAPPRAAELAAAEAQVASAQAALDDLLNGPTETELAVAEANLRAAQAGVWSSSADLQGVQDSVAEADILIAEAQVVQAQQAYDDAVERNREFTNEQTHNAMLDAEQALLEAQARYNDLLAGPDASQLSSRQASLTSSSATLEVRQSDLDALLAGPTAAEIASAEAQLASAQASLSRLTDGPSEQDIATAEAQVAQAQIGLEAAQDGLADAQLVAPFDGTVTAVNVSEGETASGVVLEMVDASSFEVVLNVDEVDVGTLTVGQPALITLEAWPTTEIESAIMRIAPSASLGTSELVTYDVYLSLETELPVLTGLTANANLITAQREDVLLLPNRALVVDRAAGRYAVFVMNGEVPQEVEVTIGLRDGENTQITGGLTEGDVVLFPDSAPDTFFGNGGPPGS